MFWKKKTSDHITVQLDDDDRRASVRIQPMDKVVIQYQQQQFEVLDISATGLSFKSETPEDYDCLDITLHLPALSHLAASEAVAIVCVIKILHSCKNTFHCQFIPLPADAQEQLDQFILSEQKRQIRERAMLTVAEKTIEG